MWKVGQKYELLSCDKHKSMAKKLKRDIAMCRPDIVHQVGLLLFFIHYFQDLFNFAVHNPGLWVTSGPTTSKRVTSKI